MPVDHIPGSLRTMAACGGGSITLTPKGCILLAGYFDRIMTVDVRHAEVSALIDRAESTAAHLHNLSLRLRAETRRETLAIVLITLVVLWQAVTG